jgi:hypothetical protein
MHPDLWGLFRRNRHLLRALPALGAGVFSDWAKEEYQAEIPIITVLHTFKSKLEFDPHLHIVAGLTGLRLDGKRLAKEIYFPASMVMERWRHAVLDLLERAVRGNTLRSAMSRKRLLKLIAYHRGLWWKVKIERKRNKEAVLSYNARYLRRPPIGDYRVISFDSNRVRFQFKEKRDQNREHELELPTKEFVARLIDHIPDGRLHGVRYSGLLSPRIKHDRYGAYLRLLGQLRRPRVRRLRWATSLRRTFKIDPLLGPEGTPLTWIRRLPPLPHADTRAP